MNAMHRGLLRTGRLCNPANQLAKHRFNPLLSNYAGNKKYLSTEKDADDKKVYVDPLLLPKKSFLESVAHSITSNLKQAWGEMTGTAKPTSLKKSLKPVGGFVYKRTNEDGSKDEEDTYDGPTALVQVRDPISPWDHMKNRLSDSPLIRQILKGSEKLKKAVADTDLGQKATMATQNVKDKIEDAREFWETSQNPLVYSISNIWDKVSGETEEGMTIGQIRKLDPNFIKASSFFAAIPVIQAL